jgi:uncharacterized protein YjbI with pentapeptide repeats
MRESPEGYRPPRHAQELLSRYEKGERFFPNSVLPQSALAQADLSGIDLTGSDLRGSSLQGAKLSQAVLQEVNLQDAFLLEADLQDADLRWANLRGADLRKANLQQANFFGAKLRDADLQDVDLKGTRGVSAGQLGGANVCGAKLPDEIKTFGELRNIEEASKHAGNLFFSLLVVCIYGLLTIGTTTDALLLTNSSSSPLPIVGAPVPIVAFYLTAPLFLLGFYLYLHLNLQRLWDTLGELPAIFPDGRPLERKAYPWLLNGLVSAYFPRLRAHRPRLSRLQAAISIFIGWWLGPATILLFWARYLRRHDSVGTILLVVLLTASIWGAISLQALAAATLRGEEAKPFFWRNALRDKEIYKRGAFFLGVFVVLYLLSFGAIQGIHPDFASGAPANSPLISNLKVIDPRIWVPRLFIFLGYSPFADLREADVSIKPPNFAGQKKEDIALVKRARLRGSNLRFADAYRAFLAAADLTGAHFQGAYLFQANLRGADLTWADLQEAFLFETDLQWAILKRANLRGVDLSGANLREANLEEAQMEGAILSEANLEGSNLRGANLMQATGLTRKQIESALIDEKTRLPDYLRAAVEAKRKTQ